MCGESSFPFRPIESHTQRLQSAAQDTRRSVCLYRPGPFIAFNSHKAPVRILPEIAGIISNSKIEKRESLCLLAPLGIRSTLHLNKLLDFRLIAANIPSILDRTSKNPPRSRNELPED